MGLAAVLAAVVVTGCATRGRLGASDAKRLQGSTFVITGASSGFGRGVALEVASHGANVVLVARRVAVLERVAAEARSAGGAAEVVAADVADAAAMDAVAQRAVDRFGRIDVWINDAGVGAIGPFDRIPAADHGRVVDTNLKGVIYGSLSALRQFRIQGRGTLVNIGSIDSEIPLAYQATYAATKAAVLSLGRSLNEELRLSGQRGIRVTTVMPWAADTPWWKHAANYSGHVPRMAAVDDPARVVAAIVHASLHPREEVPVGWKARAGYWGHRLAPDASERFAGDVAHREQMEKAAPAPDTSGAIHAPSEAGQGVEGGWRQEIRSEDEAARHDR